MKSNQFQPPITFSNQTPQPEQPHLNGLLNPTPILTSEFNKIFNSILNFITEQHKGTLSGQSDIFWDALADICIQIKASQFDLTGGIDSLYNVVSREMGKLIKEKLALKEINNDIVVHPFSKNIEPAKNSRIKLQRTDSREPVGHIKNIIEPHPDQIYITAFLTKNNKILNEIYVKYFPLIQRMVLMNSGSIDEAKDLYQEAYISIYTQAASIVLTCKFESYLYSVCLNQWRNKLKKKKNSFKEENLDNIKNYFENPIDIADQAALDNQHSDLLWENIEELGKSYQELLFLIFICIPSKDVARILNLTDGSYRTKRAKAKKRLNTLIKQSPKFAVLGR